MTDIRKSRITAAAPQMNAALSRDKFNEQQKRREEAAEVLYDETFNSALLEWMEANNVTDLSMLSPEAYSEAFAFADERAEREAKKVVNLDTAQEFFTGGADDAPSVEPITLDEALAAVKQQATLKGRKLSDDQALFAASQAVKDPKVASALRRGLVTFKEASSYGVVPLPGGGFGINIANQTPTTPQTPPTPQPQASITQTEDGGTVVEIQ